jgi:hypothetical protein
MSKKRYDDWGHDSFNDENGYYTHRDWNAVPVTFDPNTPLNTTPHYTDDRFNKPQTVYGQEDKNIIDYVYSDRIWQWDYKKAEQATEIANNSGAVLKSARWYEVYLSAFFDRRVEVLHIMAGVNVSNGYPYAVFGYKFAKETSND